MTAYSRQWRPCSHVTSPSDRLGVQVAFGSEISPVLYPLLLEYVSMTVREGVSMSSYSARVVGWIIVYLIFIFGPVFASGRATNERG
jgi:hypothetical protein